MLKWRGLALRWANNSHVNSPISVQVVLKESTLVLILAQGKELGTDSRQSTGQVVPHHQPSVVCLPHTIFQLTLSLPTSVLCTSRLCSPSPSRITSCNQAPYPLQPPVWLLLCPISQHTSIWLPSGRRWDQVVP